MSSVNDIVESESSPVTEEVVESATREGEEPRSVESPHEPSLAEEPVGLDEREEDLSEEVCVPERTPIINLHAVLNEAAALSVLQALSEVSLASTSSEEDARAPVELAVRVNRVAPPSTRSHLSAADIFSDCRPEEHQPFWCVSEYAESLWHGVRFPKKLPLSPPGVKAPYAHILGLGMPEDNYRNI